MRAFLRWCVWMLGSLIAACVVLAVLGLVFGDARNRTDATVATRSAPTDDAWPPQLGDVDVLGAQASQLGCWPSEAALGKVEKTLAAHDDLGFHQLVAQYAPDVLDAGTRVRIISGINAWNGHLRVRVLDGASRGAACWYLAGDDNDDLIARRLSSPND